LVKKNYSKRTHDSFIVKACEEAMCSLLCALMLAL